MELLLKIIFFLFLLSFLGKLFFRYVLPWWLNRFVKKQQKKYEQQFNGHGRVYEDDEISIKKETSNGEVNPDVGEYVDFEEVDDNPDNNQS